MVKQTAIYVSGLPVDVTEDELALEFSRAGIIMDDMHTGGPRIKLYSNNDALIVYLREESVELAVQLFDQTELRSSVVHVEPASFESTASDQKETKELAADTKIDKSVWKKNMEKMQSRLAWEDELYEDISRVEQTIMMECTCLLFDMFTVAELNADPGLLVDIEGDVREEAGKLGSIRTVKIYEKEECVAVKFTLRESSVACVQKMNGRWYAGRRIRACLNSGLIKP